MTDLIWSFSPWLAFLLGTRVTSLYGAVAASVAVAAVVAARAVARHRLHLLDVAGLCLVARTEPHGGWVDPPIIEVPSPRSSGRLACIPADTTTSRPG